MEPANKRGRYVAVLRMVIVAGPVKVGRHHRDEVASVLAVVSLTQLDAGDFRDGIPLVGRLKLPSEQLVLAHRLLGEFRVDAGRSKKQQFPYPGHVARADAIELDGEIFAEKLHWTGIVGEDSAYARCRHDDHLGPDR